MAQYIQRETYLQQLIDRKDNGEVKIVTGPRRSGKSWLLNRIFKDYHSFTLFYFQVMKKANAHDVNYWSNSQNSHVYSVWSGLSFEMLCLNHVDQIKKALGISGITANVFSWFGKGERRSAQIDMLIDRADRTINVCEMKFWNKPYTMTAKDEDDIERKVSTFSVTEFPSR